MKNCPNGSWIHKALVRKTPRNLKAVTYVWTCMLHNSPCINCCNEKKSNLLVSCLLPFLLTCIWTALIPVAHLTKLPRTTSKCINEESWRHGQALHQLLLRRLPASALPRAGALCSGGYDIFKPGADMNFWAEPWRPPRPWLPLLRQDRQTRDLTAVPWVGPVPDMYKSVS